MTLALRFTILFIAALLTAACNGKSGHGSPAQKNFSIGGSVTGLTGAGLVLQNNGTDNLAIQSNGAFAFSKNVALASNYAITVFSQPTRPSQTCEVINAIGKAETAVNNIEVRCRTDTFNVGGTITGLIGNGLTLNNNGVDGLVVPRGAGDFHFSTQVASGIEYAVSIAAQPINPAQRCTLQSASGKVDTQAVASIIIDCQTLSGPSMRPSLFGANGSLWIDASGQGLNDAGFAASVSLPDNKILIAGEAQVAASYDFALLRLDEIGNVDTGFNNGANGGIVLTDIDGAQDHARAIAVDASGNIYVAGYAIVGGVWKFALVRYNSNGVLDTQFGNGGKVTTAFNNSSINYAHALALDGDKIIVAGYSLQSGNNNFAVARYLSDGTPDPQFDTDGLWLKDFYNDDDYAEALAVQDGKLLVAGSSKQGANSDFTLMRLLNDGTPDPDFGPNHDGMVRTQVALNTDYAQAMLLLPSGDIVLSGYTGAAAATNVALTRYSRDGILDSHFGANGVVVTDLAGREDAGYSLLLDKQERILVAGRTYNGGNSDFLIARYDLNGAPDSGFGINGLLAVDIAGGNDEAHALTILSDGTVIAVGQADVMGHTDTAVLRIPTDDDPYTRFAIQVNVIGLQGSGLLLQNNGADDLSVARDGIYAFNTLLTSGSLYDVSVARQPTAPIQTCHVENASGEFGTRDVFDIQVLCETNSYQLTGTVTGLNGSGLVLQNGPDFLPIHDNGPFLFPRRVASGELYNVVVSSQPSAPTQECLVESGAGTVVDGDIDTIVVSCADVVSPPTRFSVGGSVAGLSGGGLVLQNNNADDLSVSANGSFSMPTTLTDGATYAIRVSSQPNYPNQLCYVQNGAGVIHGANVNDISVLCHTQRYTLGLTVSGLVGHDLIAHVENPGTGDSLDLPVHYNGYFESPALPSGSEYSVTLPSQPVKPSQHCVVAHGSGQITDHAVTDISITCSTNRFRIGGDVIGLKSGATVVLQNNGGDNKTVATDGAFLFDTAVASGDAYNVTVWRHPTGQHCAIRNGTGYVRAGNVTNIGVYCEDLPPTTDYRVGGSVSGLAGSGLQLQLGPDKAAETLDVTRNGPFHFQTRLLSGDTYTVTVLNQPVDLAQHCAVLNAAGVVQNNDIDNIVVQCTTDPWSVSVVVENFRAQNDAGNLIKPMLLQNNGADDLPVFSDGVYTFSQYFEQGAEFNVTIKVQPVQDDKVMYCGVRPAHGYIRGAPAVVLVHCEEVMPVLQVESGNWHSCAILENHQIKCWGNNMEGELGVGDRTARGLNIASMGDSLAAVDFGAGRSAKHIAVGAYHSCAILDNDQVKCWGYNRYGQLGLGDQIDRGTEPGQLGDTLAAVELGQGRHAVQLAAGNFHTCALLDNGTVKCWGLNTTGQLGQDHANTIGDQALQMGDLLSPIQLGVGRSALHIATGEHFSCAVLDNRELKCWGKNANGTLGLGTPVASIGDSSGDMSRLGPIPLGSNRTVSFINSGKQLCAILDDGEFKCWGDNAYGQLGQGHINVIGDDSNDMGDFLTTIDLGNSSAVLSFAQGQYHACALLANVGVKCWGASFYGELGQNLDHFIGDDPNEMGNALSFTQLGTGRFPTHISARENHNCVLLQNANNSDNYVKCWGSNYFGQLGTGQYGAIGDDVEEMGDFLPFVFVGSRRL